MKFRLYIFLFSTLLFSLGCNYSGTDTGNPGTPDMSTTEPAVGNSPDNGNSQSFVSTLTNIACNKLDSCFDLKGSDCHGAWHSLENVDTEIGLEVDAFEDLTELHGELLLGNISITSIENEDTCLLEISGLSCSDPEVVAAFDESEDNPYTNGAGMLPASCANVFSDE